MEDTIILGAGISGLGCARALPGARVFEAADHVGGHAYSHEFGGVHFDEGAHICHAKDPAWLELLYRQAGKVVQIRQSRVSNYWHGHWFTYPVQNHLHELPVDVKSAALSDFLAAQAAHKDEQPKNYEEWCRFQYGDFLTGKFYDEYTRKYWRVPMAELATDWLKGRLLPSEVDRIIAGAHANQEEQQSTFTLFHYPERGGFFEFFKTLYQSLPVTLNARAVEVDIRGKEVRFGDGRRETYSSLASSIPLPELVRIIKDVPDEIRRNAAQLRHTQLLCVNMIVNRAGLVPHHWFYIYDGDIDIARVSVVSNISPTSVPAGTTVLQAEIYRRNDEPLDADRLAAKAVSDVARVLKFNAERDVLKMSHVRVPYAYVISDLRRAAAVKIITAWLLGQGIYPMGLFGAWEFIWSDVAYQSGERTARNILSACPR